MSMYEFLGPPAQKKIETFFIVTFTCQSSCLPFLGQDENNRRTS